MVITAVLCSRLRYIRRQIPRSFYCLTSARMTTFTSSPQVLPPDTRSASSPTPTVLYAGHVERMNQLFSQYSDEQLILLLDFVQRLTAINRDEAGRD